MAIGGWSAAYLWGVDLLPPDAPVTIVAPRAHRMRQTARVRTHYTTLGEGDVTTFAGLPVTTGERTAFDLGRRASREQASSPSMPCCTARPCASNVSGQPTPTRGPPAPGQPTPTRGPPAPGNGPTRALTTSSHPPWSDCLNGLPHSGTPDITTRPTTGAQLNNPPRQRRPAEQHAPPRAPN